MVRCVALRARVRKRVYDQGVAEGTRAGERAADRWIVTAGVMGFTAVALGAFGAHGLESVLEGAVDRAQRLGWWETAARYHLAHALAVGLVAWASDRRPSRALTIGGAALVIGVLVFAGTLYAMALGGPRWLGAITPLGGVSLLVGWAALAASSLGKRTELDR
jgi:uncharacterized membrane protein YgdD (TMEM256/DUF423 family)